MLYFSGLRELLERPRDVIRIFNTVGVIEPVLRGEIIFSDIVGLATLMVKAPAVFELIQKNPRWFVGHLPSDIHTDDKGEEIIRQADSLREEAYRACAQPEGVRELVQFLFPKVTPADQMHVASESREADGYLACPERLVVALQLSISPGDVSLTAAKQFLLLPDRRTSLVAKLSARSCGAFLEMLGDVAASAKGFASDQLEETCLSIARLVDDKPFTESKNSEPLSVHAEFTAVRSIQLLIKAVDVRQAQRIAGAIVQDPRSITVATDILVNSYFETDKVSNYLLGLQLVEKDEICERFAENVRLAAVEGRLLVTINPAFVLWNLARLKPEACPSVLAAIREHDSSLDGFALEILKSVRSSDKGQSYAIPKESDVLEAYCSVQELRGHAEQRLRDDTVTYPARAAWRSVVESKPIYGTDGSIRKR